LVGQSIKPVEESVIRYFVSRGYQISADPNIYQLYEYRKLSGYRSAFTSTLTVKNIKLDIRIADICIAGLCQWTALPCNNIKGELLTVMISFMLHDSLAWIRLPPLLVEVYYSCAGSHGKGGAAPLQYQLGLRDSAAASTRSSWISPRSSSGG
jgi:hypothetical protein